MKTRPTFVNVILDAECNHLLDASKNHNQRSKRKEAGLRLKDHLRRFGKHWQPHTDTADDDTSS